MDRLIKAARQVFFPFSKKEKISKRLGTSEAREENTLMGSAKSKGKVCVILGMDGDYGIFLVDLNGGGQQFQFTEGSDKIMEIEPHIRVEGGPEPLIFGGVVENKMVVFYMSDESAPQAYYIELEGVWNKRNLTMKKSKMNKCRRDCLASKVLPKSLFLRGNSFSGAILLFSTRIDLFDGNEHSITTDFEIYDFSEQLPIRLPPLIVQRSTSWNCFKLFDAYNLHSFEEFYGSESQVNTSKVDFRVVSFGVDQEKLFIGTDFGCRFSLDLYTLYHRHHINEGWKLCEEGYEFLSFNENTLSFGVCFNAYGANDYRRRRWRRRYGDFEYGDCQERFSQLLSPPREYENEKEKVTPSQSQYGYGKEIHSRDEKGKGLVAIQSRYGDERHFLRGVSIEEFSQWPSPPREYVKEKEDFNEYVDFKENLPQWPSPPMVTLSQSQSGDDEETQSEDEEGQSDVVTQSQSRYGDSRTVPLPVTSIDDLLLQCVGGPYSSAVKLVEQHPSIVCTPCVVQIAFDLDTILTGKCGSSRLYFFLDVLEANMKEFPADDEEDKNNEYKKFVRQIMSFKFCVKDEQVFLASVVGLFPYMLDEQLS